MADEETVKKTKPDYVPKQTRVFIYDLETFFGEIGPIKRSFVINKKGTNLCAGFGHVHFATEADAQRAIQELDGKKFKGSTLAVELGKQREKPEESAAVKETEAEKEARLKQFRIIVRNLDFKVDEAMLRKHFEPYGKIYKVIMPPGKRKGFNSGFAFVNFTDFKSAEKAVKRANGTDINGRTVAVDHTVSRNKFQVAKEQENEPEPVENGIAKVDDSEEDEENEEEEEGDLEEKDEEDDDEDEEEHPRKVHRSSDVHLGKTLFLRNVSFDTDEDKLVSVFSKYGKIKFAKLVIDKVSGEPRGTAFVQFEDKENADKCLKSAYANAMFNRNRKHENESDIVVNGRRLIISVAVTPKTAEELNKKGSDGKKDKRNLRLAEYGILSLDDIKNLTKDEKAKYERGQHEKNTKLANPNFHVSLNRICLRNLPKETGEAVVKALVVKMLAKVDPKAKLKQVKVVRDKEKNDKSRGFAFVEFYEHGHALSVLKKLHNKRHKELNDRLLFAEFSLENSRILRAREDKLMRQAIRRKRKEKETTEEPEEKPKKRLITPTKPEDFELDDEGNSKNKKKRKRNLVNQVDSKPKKHKSKKVKTK